MRAYIVHYFAEKHDECQDLEKEIQAETPEAAITAFRAKGIVYKRVYGAMEKSSNLADTARTTN